MSYYGCVAGPTEPSAPEAVLGTFTHPITLHSPDGSTSGVVEALVDTGATFTSIPAPILEQLGVVPHRTVRVRLANGNVELRPLAEIRVELDGESDTILCVSGDPNAPAVIRAHTLEGFLLRDDPVEMRLVPVMVTGLRGHSA